MRRDLEFFYEQELFAIRQLAKEFAQDRPKIAARLLLEPETSLSSDPHVERLIEAFAFLTGRIRLKIEDEFPELTDSLLGLLYPQILSPVPSAAIAQFELDPTQGNLKQGFQLRRGSRLYTPDWKGVRCRFRTTADSVVWPLEIESVEWRTAPFGDEIRIPAGISRTEAVIRVVIRARGARLEELAIDRLRFFLGTDERTGYQLHERLLRDLQGVVVSATSAASQRKQTILPSGAVQATGFVAEEGLLPYDTRLFPGYGLLLDYFAFPRKFLFCDVTGLPQTEGRPFGERFELWFCLPKADLQLQSRINRESFRLGCIPVVNHFTHTCDPIRLDQTRNRYPLVPDARLPHGYEVFSIDRVYSTDVTTGESREYQPFFSCRHTAERDSTAYWHADREPSRQSRDQATDLWMSFVDLEFSPSLPTAETIHVTATCSNRDLPFEFLGEGSDASTLYLEGAGPVRRVQAIVPPTRCARPSLTQSRWRLISHLSLNHLSLSGGEDGAYALREILKLYDHVDSRVTAQHIEGLLRTDQRRKTARLPGGPAAGFAHGLEVTLTFDAEKYAGAGLYLFALVMEQFLGECVSLNTFCQTVCRTVTQSQPFLIGPCRAGRRLIL